MKEITPLNLTQCWKMVNRISNLEQARTAEAWLAKANITAEEYDDLMDAVAYITRDPKESSCLMCRALADHEFIALPNEGGYYLGHIRLSPSV